MKAIMHSEGFVSVKEFPNELFEKKLDNLHKIEYIIIENKKYYIHYPLCINEQLDEI